MGTPTFRLYCSWHVMKAWKKELIALIKNKVTATEIWHCLLTVLVQVDEDDFEAIFKKIFGNVSFFSRDNKVWRVHKK